MSVFLLFFFAVIIIINIIGTWYKSDKEIIDHENKN